MYYAYHYYLKKYYELTYSHSRNIIYSFVDLTTAYTFAVSEKCVKEYCEQRTSIHACEFKYNSSSSRCFPSVAGADHDDEKDGVWQWCSLYMSPFSHVFMTYSNEKGFCSLLHALILSSFLI